MKELLEVWGAQLGVGGLGIATMLFFLVKSGKFSITLFAPTQEKAAQKMTEVLLANNVDLMEKNLSHFTALGSKVHAIETHLQHSEGHLRAIATTQQLLLNEVLRQSGYMEGARR